MSSSNTKTEFNQYQELRHSQILSNVQDLLDVENPIYQISKEDESKFTGEYKQVNIECDYPIFEHESYQIKYNLDRKRWCLYNDLEILYISERDTKNKIPIVGDWKKIDEPDDNINVSITNPDEIESAERPTLKTKLWNLLERIGLPENLERKFLKSMSILDVWNILISHQQKKFLEKKIDTSEQFNVMRSLFSDYCLYRESSRFGLLDDEEMPQTPRGIPSFRRTQSTTNANPRLVRQPSVYTRQLEPYDFGDAEGTEWNELETELEPQNELESETDSNNEMPNSHTFVSPLANILAEARQRAERQHQMSPEVERHIPSSNTVTTGTLSQNNHWYGHDMTVWPPTNIQQARTFSWLLCPIIFWSLTLAEEEHVFPELLDGAVINAWVSDSHPDEDIQGVSLLSVLPLVRDVLKGMGIYTLQDLQPHIDGPNHLTANFQEEVMDGLRGPAGTDAIRIIAGYAQEHSPDAYQQSSIGRRIAGTRPRELQSDESPSGGAYIQYGGNHDIYKVSGSAFDEINGLYRIHGEFNGKPEYRKNDSPYMIIFRFAIDGSYWALCGPPTLPFPQGPGVNIYYKVAQEEAGEREGGDYPTQDVVWEVGSDIEHLDSSGDTPTHVRHARRRPIQVTNFNNPALIEVIPYIPNVSLEEMGNYYSGTWKFHGRYRLQEEPDNHREAVYKHIHEPTIQLSCDIYSSIGTSEKDIMWSIEDTSIINEGNPLVYLFTNELPSVNDVDTVGITDVLDNRNIIGQSQGILKWDNIKYPDTPETPETHELFYETLRNELDNPDDFPYGKISYVQVNEVIEEEPEPELDPEPEVDETDLFLEFQRTTIRDDSQKREAKIVREPADTDSPEADYFIWKQYLERLFNVTDYTEIPSLVDNDINIMNKFSKIPIGRVEFVGETGLDYGGLRPNFFKSISKNISKCFLQTVDRLKHQRDNEILAEMEQPLQEFKCIGKNNKLMVRPYNNNPFKGSEYGTKLSYTLAGATLAKMLSCDNGVKSAPRGLSSIRESRIIFPNLHLTLYLIERLRGNELENWLDIVTLFSLDNPESYQNMMNTLTMENLEIIELPPASQVEARLLEPNPEIEVDDVILTNKNKFAHMFVTAIHYYEHNLLEEIYYFTKGFNLVLPSETDGICYTDKKLPKIKKCLTTQDLSSIISGGDIKIEDLKAKTTWKYQVPQDEGNKITNWFWEILNEWEDENGKLIYKLLDLWIAQRTLPDSGMTIIVKPCPEECKPGANLPTSHTCFFILDIFNYKKKEDLKNALSTAILNLETGFHEAEHRGGNKRSQKNRSRNKTKNNKKSNKKQKKTRTKTKKRNTKKRTKEYIKSTKN